MPDQIYELVAQAARYWFLLLMALIVWRSYRWLARDRKQRKKRLRLLPDAGYVGELLVARGNGDLPEGLALPVSKEGVLGSVRGDDVYVPVSGVRKRHLWYEFDEENGLFVEPYGAAQAEVNGQPLNGRRSNAYLTHGSRLKVGDAELRLRMFAGFEHAGVTHAPSHAFQDAPAEPAVAAQGAVAFTPEQLLAVQQMQQMQQIQQMQQMQWMAAWQAAQGMQPGAAATGAPANLAGVAPVVAGMPAYPAANASAGAETPASPALAGGVPVPAVLSTARGEFLPPPKVTAGGSILPRGDSPAAQTDAAENAAPVQATRATRRTRDLPLPPLDSREAAAPETPDGYDAPDTWDAPVNRDIWSADMEYRPDRDEMVTPNALFAPRVQFFPPVLDDAPETTEEPVLDGDDDPQSDLSPLQAENAWLQAPDEGYGARGENLPPDYGEPDAPYEYADEDEAPRSLYVEPDEAEKAKRLLWDKYLKGGRRG